jgi:hypothetical protein
MLLFNICNQIGGLAAYIPVKRQSGVNQPSQDKNPGKQEGRFYEAPDATKGRYKNAGHEKLPSKSCVMGISLSHSAEDGQWKSQQHIVNVGPFSFSDFFSVAFFIIIWYKIYASIMSKMEV